VGELTVATVLTVTPPVPAFPLKSVVAPVPLMKSPWVLYSITVSALAAVDIKPTQANTAAPAIIPLNGMREELEDRRNIKILLPEKIRNSQGATALNTPGIAATCAFD
jgi:hypothetical protein